MNGGGATDKQNEEKTELNAKIESVKAEQAAYNERRSKIQAELKKHQDTVKRKVKFLLFQPFVANSSRLTISVLPRTN